MIDGTVVIGHGPSLIDSSQGEYIDSFRYVMRFPHKGDWQIPEHYGKRTSFYVGTTMRMSTKLRQDRPDLGYFTWTKRCEPIRKTDFIAKLLEEHGGWVVTDLVDEWQVKLPNIACPFLSHGAAAILIAAAVVKLPVTALGCDALRDGMPRRHPYVGTWYHENLPERPNEHCCDDELKLVYEMSEIYDVPITFE
jgi:hypothetical protein